MPWNRRSAALGLLLAALAARAQPVTRAVGVYAVLGDTMDVSLAPDPSASRMDRSSRESIALPQLGFDRIAANEAKTILGRVWPTAFVNLYRASTPLNNDAQRELLANAERGGLPGWMLDEVAAQRLTHLLIISRERAAGSIEDADGVRNGRIRLEGLGFHIDPMITVRHQASGRISQGGLGAHVIVRLSLFDVEAARVLRSQTINTQWLIGGSPERMGRGPWEYLTPQEKVEALRGALVAGLREQLPAVLKGD